jgi:hypothetical protein
MDDIFDLLTLGIMGIVVVVIIFFSTMFYVYGTDEYVTFTVVEKERVAESDSARYLIFTDGEVFENTDSLWYWKWRSSDIYGNIKEGKTYNAHVYGWRVPFFSWYRNIIKMEEVSPSTEEDMS